MIYGGPVGLSDFNDQIWAQDSDGIAGQADGGNNFGDALAVWAPVQMIVIDPVVWV